MKLEDQVCTLEQSKKLKELGITQYSLFYHIDNLVKEIGYEGIKLRHSINPLNKGMPVDGGVVRYYSAFTVAELGVMLPTGYDTMRITSDKSLKSFEWNGYDLEGEVFSFEGFDTEAQCRAAMVIYLIESNNITPFEVNNRLSTV